MMASSSMSIRGMLSTATTTSSSISRPLSCAANPATISWIYTSGLFDDLSRRRPRPTCSTFPKTSVCCIDHEPDCDPYWPALALPSNHAPDFEDCDPNWLALAFACKCQAAELACCHSELSEMYSVFVCCHSELSEMYSVFVSRTAHCSFGTLSILSPTIKALSDEHPRNFNTPASSLSTVASPAVSPASSIREPTVTVAPFSRPAGGGTTRQLNHAPGTRDIDMHQFNCPSLVSSQEQD